MKKIKIKLYDIERHFLVKLLYEKHNELILKIVEPCNVLQIKT